MRLIFLVSGLVSLALGIVGIFLPVLPTTPFLLLSASLFLRSSEKLYRWLMDHPQLGSYIRNFREHKALPLRVKIISVSLLWLTLLYCAFGVAEHWALSILFLTVAAGVTAYLLNFKTLRD